MSSSSTDPCLSAQDVVTFLAGELSPAAARRVETHADRCSPCCELLAHMARSPLASPTPPAEPGPVTAPYEARALVRGDVVGRYVVTSELGAGGMGVVYVAYDPELDRRVALKLLRPVHAGDEAIRERLLKEARALARLSHRNVVAIFDVGTHEGQVFLAMELVEGQTLRQWTTQAPRTWREIVAMYAQAGSGLASAHAAGIVHRDFKPSNVLVSDTGRAVVLDFGLARAVHTERTTGRHLVVGTPRYMAPEQRIAEVVDARTDQYSFCVALTEALRDATVPRAVRRLLQRGAADDPDDRHPSMDVLLGGLSRRTSTRRRRIAAGVGAGLLGLGAGAVLMFRDPAPCEQAEARMSAVWDDQSQQDVQAAFAATGRPYADEAWAAVASALDERSRAWVEQYTEACEATHVYKTQSERQLDLRMMCLQRQRSEVRALAELFRNADGAVVDRAAQAATSLPPVSRCAPHALASVAQLPSDAAQREEIEAVLGLSARARALQRAGRFDEAVSAALAVEQRSAAIEHAPTRATVLLDLSATLVGTGDIDEAERRAYAGLWLAQAGRDDAQAARAWNALAWIDGYFKARFELARRHADHAAAAIERVGGDDDLELDRLRNRAWTALKGGQPAQAEADFRAALQRATPGSRDALLLEVDIAGALITMGRFADGAQQIERTLPELEHLLGPDHPDMVVVLNNLGSGLRELGRFDEALDTYRRAERLVVAAQGESHAQVGRIKLNKGTLLADAGRFDEAANAFESAGQVLRATQGAAHPEMARVHDGLASVRFAQGDYAAAAQLYARSLAIKEAVLPPDHPDIALTLTNLGMTRIEAGDSRGGLESLERALASMTTSLGPDHPRLASVLNGMATAHEGLGSIDEARAQYRQAADIAKAAGAPVEAQSLTQLGTLELTAHDPVAAARVLRRALTLRARNTGEDPVFLAETRFRLAQALWRTGARAEANQLAQLAQTVFTERDEEAAAELAAWLTARR